MGLLWGLWTGELSPALPLALFYELFWLDLFAVGTYVPPNALLPLLCLLTLSHIMGLADPWILSVLALVLLPMAHLGTWLELRHRLWQISGYNRLLRAFRMGRSLEFVSSWALALSLVQLFFMNFLLFFVIAWASCPLLMMLVPFIPEMDHVPPLSSWTMLWAIGALGGLMALRIRRSFALFSLMAGAAALYGFVVG